MKAVIFAIGSELLQGFLVDTNSQFLAQELTAIGIDVVSIHGVGDDQPAITRAMRQAMDDADLLVCTGGVGPTSDDLSREAVAEICGEEPVVDPDLLTVVESFFRRRGSVMPERNSKQAWLIPSAEPLTNAMGTAPGWFVHTSGVRIVLMPGVPREMTQMWQHEVVPRLLPFLGENSIASTTLKTIGIGESSVEEALRQIIDREYPIVSTYAKNDGVHIRIVATAGSAREAEQAVQYTEQEIRQIIGAFVYGGLTTSLPAALLQPLLSLGAALSIWECGTAGQVTSLFMSDPEVSTAINRGHVEPRPGELADSLASSLVSDSLTRLIGDTGSQYGLGVLVRTGDSDDMGRLDAVIDIIVQLPTCQATSRHSFAAREMELGRRASLLAAEKFREALMASTAVLQG